MTTPEPAQTTIPSKWRQHLKALYIRIKSLQGDPHYVALGIASGVFVAVTPTIPFHTVLALAVAFVLKGSKPAAIIGAWFGNPLTIPPFYFASYHFGMLLLGRKITVELHTSSYQAFLAQGTDVVVAMMVAGALLGIIPAVAAYYLTFKMFTQLHARRQRAHLAESAGDLHLPGPGNPLPGADIQNKTTP
jgi:uncharacterized protein